MPRASRIKGMAKILTTRFPSHEEALQLKQTKELLQLQRTAASQETKTVLSNLKHLNVKQGKNNG